MTTPIAQLVVDGMGMGLIYVILAAGLVLMMKVSGILLIAYGEFFTIGAMTVWATVELLHVPFLAGLGIAVLTSVLCGLGSYWLIFRFIQHRESKFLAQVVAAVGLMMVLGQTTLLIFGTVPQKVTSVFSGMVRGAGISISVEKLVLMATALATTLALVLFYEKTKMGRAMRAVSFNPDVASLQGVNTDRIYMVTMGISGALAGFAGAIMAPVYQVHPEMGRDIFFSILLVVILGGMGSIAGAVVGGLVLGITLSFGLYFAGGVSQILLFVVIGLIIFFRPGGLLGRSAEL
jgi:branched-chain amino acid transport system permease protein